MTSGANKKVDIETTIKSMVKAAKTIVDLYAAAVEAGAMSGVAMNGHSVRRKARHKKNEAVNGETNGVRRRPLVKQSVPKPETNMRRIYDYLMRRPNELVASESLEELLKTRREPGNRVSGDAACVSSNISYLKKNYRIDIERVSVGVYRLHKPKRRRGR